MIPSDVRRRLSRRSLLIGAAIVLTLAGGAAAVGLMVAGAGFDLSFAAENEAADTANKGLGPQNEIVRPAAIFEVDGDDNQVMRVFPGVAQPAKVSRLAFRVSGPLIALPVREGQEVPAGALLARIDPRDFGLAVAELEAQLQSAEAARRLAELNYERRAQLVDRGAVSRAELDRAIAERDQSVAAVASLTQALRTARAARSDTRLTAPFAGRVARLHVEVGDYVNATQPVTVLHDVSATDLVLTLPEGLVSRSTDIVGIEVEFASRPGRRYSAEIFEIASEQGADTSTYRTRLRVSGFKEEAPLAGQSGTAFLSIAKHNSRDDQTVLIPASAVFAGGDGGDRVWIVEGEQPAVSARRVDVTGREGDRIRISGGLRPGERIVAYGAHFLSEGQRITPFRQEIDVAGGQR